MSLLWLLLYGDLHLFTKKTFLRQMKKQIVKWNSGFRKIFFDAIKKTFKAMEIFFVDSQK